MSALADIAQSSVHQTEVVLSGVLLQLAIIVAAGRIAGSLAARVHQARVVGEILVGVLLGPSLFGALAPDLFAQVFAAVSPLPLTIMSQIGLILLMFEIGMEFDFSLLRHGGHRRATLLVAGFGIVGPFLLGAIFGYVTAPVLAPGVSPGIAGLFIGTAFSITALPVLGRILLEFKLTRAPIGVIAISAAAINDVIGWLLLAVVTALAASRFSAVTFAGSLGALAVYVAACWFLVRPALQRVVRRDAPGQGPGGETVAFVLCLLFVSALATYAIGIFAIFGGFMVGLLVHEERAFVTGWNQRVGTLVHVLFMPIFFTLTGLRTRIGSLDTVEAWGWCVLLIALAMAGKFGGCYLAGRLSGQGHVAAKILGVLMNARGLMELIVINVGYDIGVISQQMFTMLVLMALASNVIPTPALKYWTPRLPHA